MYTTSLTPGRTQPRDTEQLVRVRADRQKFGAVSQRADAGEVAPKAQHIGHELNVKMRRPVAILGVRANLGQFLPGFNRFSFV